MNHSSSQFGNRPGTVFVTGATGFIGTHLVRKLVEAGHQVKALCRRKNLPELLGEDPAEHPLRHQNVELIHGELQDRTLLQHAMRDVDYVFHLAGLARQWEKDPRSYDQVNVDGMRHVLEAAERNQVRRILVTSTIVTFGPTIGEQVGNESMPRNTVEYFTEYERSKAFGELKALEFARRGVPIVIVNPTRVFGPGLMNEGNSVTRLIDEYDRGRFPFLLNGGINRGNYVFVQDVVNGHLLAMANGRVGERYILGSENISLKGLLELVDELTGKSHFMVTMRGTPKTIAWLHEKRAKWTGIYPKITPGWIQTFLADWVFETSKAERELGYQPTPIRDGIRVTLDWLRANRPKPATIRPPTWLSRKRRSAKAESHVSS